MEYNYNKEFCRRILRLLTVSSWLASYGIELILPEYFVEDEEKDFAQACITYYSTYSKAPTKNDLSVIKNVDLDLLEDVFNQDVSDFVSDTVIQFARTQAAKLAVLDCVEEIEKGKLDNLTSILDSALKVGRNYQEVFALDVKKDFDNSYLRSQEEKVPTGLLYMDKQLEGGLGVPGLGIILAPFNRGKTMFLINIGFGAAGIGSARNVVHFTHEVSAKEVVKRYAARAMFRFVKAGDNFNEYSDEYIKRQKLLMPGNVKVIGGRKSYAQMKADLNRLQGDGFKFDVIISDYLDLIVGSTKRERRFELSDNAQFLRDLSEEYGVPVWTATQSTRGGGFKESLHGTDVSEDKGKVDIADVVYGLNQTKDELMADQCRLSALKLRSNDTKVPEIACKFYGRSQAIVTVGEVMDKADDD